MPVRAAPLLLLPDISEYQYPPELTPGADMNGIGKKNGGAAIIRVCYGADHPDKGFAAFRKAASSFRFLGLYQYLVASQPVLAQAERFVQLTGQLAPHEIAILDLEEGAGSQRSRAQAWLSYVDQALGLSGLPLAKRSWLYTGLSYASTAGLTPIVLSGRHAWIAAYGQTEPALGHTLWQCTNGKTGAHITSWPGAGKCDTSLYHGTLAELAHLIDRGQAARSLLLEETMPFTLNGGKDAKTPISLPDGTKSVRFFSNTDADILVDVRKGKKYEVTLKLDYDHARSVEVPAGIHGIVVHRLDSQHNEVSYALNS